MKLASVKYDENSERWYTPDYLPDTPRSIILHTTEGGSAEGKYEKGEWIQYRWNCKVTPLYWREMPRWKQR